MSNVQVLTIAIALATSFLAVLAGVLMNNTRLNDVKELLAAKVETRAAARDLYELRVLIEKKFADLDNRLSRIENERRIVS